jgi:2,4-dienoyl-CoA reductase-like NADH-dependent reductase (Old Yellow Enzyme family)
MPTLFDPLKLGAIHLPNRIIMAPLTRSRATPDGRVPTQLQVDYYRQRATAGLIISEATSVSAMGVGYAATPGIWSDEQTEGWKAVTKAVHDAGGRMVLQLWHVGRISAPLFLNGAQPEAPSAVKPKGHVSLVRPEQEYVTPRALEESEFPASWPPTSAARKMPARPASTASISTAPMAICWTSSCRIPPTNAPTGMAARWRTVPV